MAVRRQHAQSWTTLGGVIFASLLPLVATAEERSCEPTPRLGRPLPALNTPVSIVARQVSGGIPPAIFWTFVAAILFILVIAAGIFYWRWRRKRNRRAAERENAARARTLNEGITPSPGPPIPLVSMPPHVYGGGDLASREAEPRQNFPIQTIVEPASGDPAADGSRHDKVRRAQLRRLAALREAQLKEAARRTQATVSTIAEPAGPDESGPSGPGNIYALDDTVSRSDDSQFDVIRRGPTVNPAFQAARDQQYQQRIAAGYTYEQAMSVSEASTEESEGPGPLAVSTAPPRRAPTSPSGIHLVPPQRPLARTTSVQFGPLSVPERWQPRATTDATTAAATDGNGASAEIETTCLREPLPPRGNGGVQQRDSWRFSQVDVGFTETDETATRASTVISDDPWRAEVLENRRRQGN